MMYRIAVLEGDGIGPEIIPVAVDAVSKATELTGAVLEFERYPAGDQALEELGEALPEETLKAVGTADATLKGPVGETAKDVIVRLRQVYDLYVNLRPAKTIPGVKALASDVDVVIVRENTEDLYKGFEFELPGAAIALKVITEAASMRIAEFAFDLAERRRKHVTIVHKANVLPVTDGLFARCAHRSSSNHPDVAYRDMYVDAASMAIVRDPRSFDVILTSNMYGDILSDELAQVVGGLGVAPAANIGDGRGLFEPVHGSAPDIAGRDIANPYAAVLSAAMMLDWLGNEKADGRLSEASMLVEKSVIVALGRGAKTPDLGGSHRTSQVSKELEAIIDELWVGGRD